MVLFFFFSTNQNSIAWNSRISYISIWNKGAKQRGVIDLFYGNILFCVFIFMVDQFNLFTEIFQGGHGLASSFPFSITCSETNLMILIHSKLLHKSTSFWNNPYFHLSSNSPIKNSLKPNMLLFPSARASYLWLQS